MKNNIQSVLQLTSIFLICAIALSCGKASEVKTLETKLDALKELSGTELISKSESYISQLVEYEQTILDKSPKKLDIKLLEKTARVFTMLIEDKSEIGNNVIIRLNYATTYMLMGSYYNSQSDILKATEAVQKASIDFDKLAKEYPQNILVRALRAINYSHLPELFGKLEIIKSDYEMVIEQIIQGAEMSSYEKGVLEVFFSRGLKYYAQDEDMVQRINDALDVMQ